MKMVYLSGGVGGARLLDGLAQIAPTGSLTAIVNVGDDFDHWGLRVCPDLDSVMYTLGNVSDEARGWGLANETFRALEMVNRYGGENWFQLGDGDLATHVLRTRWLAQGESLTRVTARLAQGLGIGVRLLPASDSRWSTLIDTEHDGTLSFQEWLVHKRAQPAVNAVRFSGDGESSLHALVALESADLVIIGPSNPYVSIDPILALRGMQERLLYKKVIAVSPIVSGRAIKGPLAEMIPRLAQRAASAGAIAAHYARFLTGMVVERGDEQEIDTAVQADARTFEVLPTATVMRSKADRVDLAKEVLAFGKRLVHGS